MLGDTGALMVVSRIKEDAPAGLDTTIPNVARMYDYLLGGKGNITHAVPVVPHSDHTQIVQARQAHHSKIAVFTVRDLSCTCLYAYVRFAERVLLTPS